MAENNAANTDNNNNGAGGQPPADQQPNNAGGGDTTDNKGDGKTIPVESYNVIRDKYQKAKEQLEAREAAEAEAEKKRLEEQGKYKELAEKAESEKTALQTKYETNAKSNALKLAALQAGTVDADAVAALVDLGTIKLSDDGSVDADSVKSVIETLKESKAYLFGTATPPKPNNVGGNGGTPSGDNNSGVKEFKRSQLRDAKFYKENEADILKAAAAGKIIDDVSQR